MLSLVDGGNVWTGLGMWQTMCLFLLWCHTTKPTDIYAVAMSMSVKCCCVLNYQGSVHVCMHAYCDVLALVNNGNVLTGLRYTANNVPVLLWHTTKLIAIQ